MFNEEELLNRKNIIAKTLTEISYHINSGNWEHTRKYYEMMELKNLEPKTLNDFLIAIAMDSCEEVFEVDENIVCNEEVEL